MSALVPGVLVPGAATRIQCVVRSREASSLTTWPVGWARGDGEALNHHSGGAGAPHADAAPGVPDRAAYAIPAPAEYCCPRAHHHTIELNQPRISSQASSSNLEGVATGYATAVQGLRKNATNRVVLISDGLANDGETDPDAILERIDGDRREYGITLFGVGVGSDYGDALMERLADKGDGHTVYVADTATAADVFCRQLPQNIDLVARDAKAQVAFDPHTVAEFHLIGYQDRKVADEDFRNDRVDGGEVGPGHTVTALYAVRTNPGTDGHLATATVRWLDPDTRTPHENTGAMETGSLHGSVWTASPRFQVTAVAAYFADALAGGRLRHPGSAESDQAPVARSDPRKGD
ncbi:von Willebrand factor type A domain-containing protein [Streptomyces sp. Ag109_O5-1]|nr:von Willebrand factor type A domain-containing protein [Streptomyces sp. Ag109_O5-1]